MSKFKEALAPFKMPLILIAVLAVLYIVLGIIVPGINSAKAGQSPIVGIEATNNKQYNSSEEVKAGDFSVNAIHENGQKSKLSTDDIILSQTTLNPVGSQTSIILTYAGNSKLTCTVDVSVNREEIIRFECGYPDKTNVCAVLYSNGELCFEGKGDVYTYDEGAFPWTEYENADKNPIRSVTFQEDVKPTDMNYWFEGNEQLMYVDQIPDSVKTMVRTFANCTSLESMADWTKDNALLNITECYLGCENLKQVCALPPSAKIAQRTFSSCKSIQETPDASNSKSLIDATNMYEGCSKLVKISMPPNVENITGMFLDCINLKDMPDIPVSVTTMNYTFQNDVSLTNLSTIPEKVDSLSGCFSNCQLASGSLIINANSKEFDDMFGEAVLATKVDLTGDSVLLDAYANTSTTGRVTVNGKSPDLKIRYYDDVIKETE